jgi:tetratricopeptide (TPR) repeat protein
MAAQWFVQAAEALDHAHNQGIVHRDIKPSNLMISHDGDLWVTDFGLARTCRDASMTASGELLGTLRYMSPEQLRSKPGIVDHRTDIYSLGLTLYELISGRPAFAGQTQAELTRQIESDDPPSLVRIDPRVPRDLDSIVLKAIAKSADGRYPSARDLADDLRSFLAGRPTVARPATWRDRGEKWVRRHSRLAASAAVALALVLVCAVASTVLVWRAQTETQRALGLASENHRRAEGNLQDARQAVDELFTGVATDLADVPGAENVRYRLLHQARAYYQKFAAQAGSSAAVRGETAAAYYRCGQISEQLGDDDVARAAYEDAKRVWSALRAEFASDETLRPLALCENNLGLIELRAGRLPEAESHLRVAMELGRRRATRDTDDVQATCDLALSYANLGMTLGQARRTEEALTCLQTALEMQLSTNGTSALARGDLAATYNQLGYLHSFTSTTEAETDYRHSADEFERLAQAEPRVLRWQAQLATTLNNLAALAGATQRLDEAEAAYRRAIDIQTRLSERAPQVAGYLRDLAVSQNNFGYLLSQQNRADAAIEQFDGARVNLTRLAQGHETSAEYASRLGAVCNNLGLVCENQPSSERSQAAYREAIDWQQKALSLSPGWQQAQSYLAAHTANLARLLRATDQGEAAKELKNQPLPSGVETVQLTGKIPFPGHPLALPIIPPPGPAPALAE